MVEYICERCNKTWTKKYDFTRHVNRKFKCKETIKPVIEYNKYELLMKKIEELEKQITHINNSSINNIVNKVINTDNSKTINVIVTPNAFGKEDLSFIDKSASNKILSKGFKSIPKLIETVHFNKNKPEYHNVYIPNWRDRNKVLVFDGVKWILANKDDVFEDLTNKGIEFIQKKYDELDETDKGDATIIKKIKNFMETCENYEKNDFINDDLQLVLYNNRKIVEKSRKL